MYHECVRPVGGDLGDNLGRAVWAGGRLDHSANKVQVELVPIHAKVEEM
jgi:hypothetical protein